MAVVGGVSAVVLIGGIGLGIHRLVVRIPRSVLQLVVGVLLTTFGSFWALEGMGIDWPLGDGAIIGLLILYGVTALSYIALERRRVLRLSPGT